MNPSFTNTKISLFDSSEFLSRCEDCYHPIHLVDIYRRFPKERPRGGSVTEKCGAEKYSENSLNALGGFGKYWLSPPSLRQPHNVTRPEKVIQHYRTAQGRSGGKGTVPSIDRCFVFYRETYFSTEYFLKTPCPPYFGKALRQESVVKTRFSWFWYEPYRFKSVSPSPFSPLKATKIILHFETALCLMEYWPS